VARNVEIKARSRNPARQRELAARIAHCAPVEIVQEDTFYDIPGGGRLKLRTLSPTRGELILYRRADSAAPRLSEYRVVATDRPGELGALLAAALPVRGSVRKRRLLFLVGRTRVHLDDVEGLGDFIEIEVVLGPHEVPRDGEREAHALMTSLEIEDRDLVAEAYVDLLGDRSKPVSPPDPD
jgi:adenylate cyclase class IV